MICHHAAQPSRRFGAWGQWQCPVCGLLPAVDVRRLLRAGPAEKAPAGRMVAVL